MERKRKMQCGDILSFAHTKFDENGHLTDEMAIDLIKKLLERLVDEIRKQKNILN